MYLAVDPRVPGEQAVAQNGRGLHHLLLGAVLLHQVWQRLHGVLIVGCDGHGRQQDLAAPDVHSAGGCVVAEP